MPKFISFFGPLGSGKTTRAKLLANFLDIPFCSEKADSPFLTDMFLKKKSAFLNQLHFLYSDRNEILNHVNNEHKFVIFDYHIAQVDIFSCCFLGAKEYSEFKKHYDYVIEQLPLPQLIFYLKVAITLNLSRIKERGRSYERLDEELIKKMHYKTASHIEALRGKTNIIEIDASYDVIDSFNSRLEILSKMVSHLEQ